MYDPSIQVKAGATLVPVSRNARALIDGIDITTAASLCDWVLI